MLDEDFLKERQNIREKMLRYSRAVKKGIVPKEVFDEHDDILKRRVKKDKKNYFDDFEDIKEKRPQANIYLKEDLINVKLEDKKPFLQKLFAKRKKNKNEKSLDKKLALNKKESTKQELRPVDKNNTKQNKIKEIKHKENPKENKAFDVNNAKDLQKPAKEPSKEPLIESANSEEKESLLTNFNESMKADRNLNFNNLLFSFLLLFFACIIFIPQIYIRNNIYYLSREITVLRSQENVLSEENKELKRKLENMRFKNQILDYLE